MLGYAVLIQCATTKEQGKSMSTRLLTHVTCPASIVCPLELKYPEPSNYTAQIRCQFMSPRAARHFVFHTRQSSMHHFMGKNIDELERAL
ncbi:hypothetical protein RSK20926_14524 [Roseobacter sp. SK209-2-6]|nr:hypothetical protein RSK20926_14524 [Roseobacter sp. SK209-2-6]